MSAYKQFTSKDIIVSPLTVHASSSAISNNTVSSFTGSNENAIFLTGSGELTGSYPLDNLTGINNPALVYNSIKQLFYSNYLRYPFAAKTHNGTVSDVGTASFNPDGTISGPLYTPSYINFPQDKDENRVFPSGSGKKIGVSTITQKAFGDYIKPGSGNFTYTVDGGTPSNLKDMGNGEIFIVNSGGEALVQFGNIFYKEGIAVTTGGLNSAGSGDAQLAFTSWVSSYTLYETQYTCTIRPSEFNYSTNPTLLSSSLQFQNGILEKGSSKYSDFATGSDFTPYVTTVGLYNNDNELMAVAKLAQPLPTSKTTNTTILINLDR